MIKKLLYVEDEPELLLIVAQVLRSSFEVIEASSVEEALTIINNEDQIDVLITDYNLGNNEVRNGLDIAKAFRDHFPKSRMIMVTGSHLSATQERMFIGKLKGALYEKPFQISHLHKIIEA